MIWGLDERDPNCTEMPPASRSDFPLEDIGSSKGILPKVSSKKVPMSAVDLCWTRPIPPPRRAKRPPIQQANKGSLTKPPLILSPQGTLARNAVWEIVLQLFKKYATHGPVGEHGPAQPSDRSFSLLYHWVCICE